MKSVIYALPAIILFSGNIIAQTPAPSKQDWKLSAELGFSATSGNTDTQTLNTKGEASTDRELWRHKIEASILNASDNDQTTARKFNLSGQSDYKLEAPAYLFATISYEDDKFSGYDYRMVESVGYGRRVIDDESLTVDLDIGPGLRQSKLSSGESDNEGLIRTAAKVNWIISNTSTLTENLSIEAGEDVTVTKSVTSLTSQIEGNLSMKVSFSFQNSSKVPAGIDKTDTETAITLVYSF